MNNRFGAVILAAGGSTRMGRPKQRLPVAGRSMLRRAAEAAVDAGCRPVHVVLGAHYEALLPELKGLDVSPIINSEWSNGIGSSIRTGIAALVSASAPVDTAVILLCDQPEISAAVIRRLLIAHFASGKAISVSAFAGTFGPPVIVSSKFFEPLLHLPDNQGAKALWAAHPEQVHLAPCPEASADVDTPEEYDGLVGHD